MVQFWKGSGNISQCVNWRAIAVEDDMAKNFHNSVTENNLQFEPTMPAPSAVKSQIVQTQPEPEHPYMSSFESKPASTTPKIVVEVN